MNANKLIDSFGNMCALVVGDVMVDSYIWGNVERMSPEAPVPVVSVNERSARLGGAANVARNIRSLGAKAIIASVIGSDDQGEKMISLLENKEISTAGLIRSGSRITTVKTRIISDNQHIVRVDEEQTDAISDQEAQELIARVAELIDQADVLILEDYNKGVLTKTVITELIQLAAKAGVPVAVDPKKENFFAYKGVQLFKPNLKELREGMKMEIADGDKTAIQAAARKLKEVLGNAYTLVTLSEHGVFIDDGETALFIPAHERSIVDVSGAGDSSIAAAALCLACNANPAEIALFSNLAGGIVCEHVGVVPIEKEDLRREAIRALTNT